MEQHLSDLLGAKVLNAYAEDIMQQKGLNRSNMAKLLSVHRSYFYALSDYCNQKPNAWRKFVSLSFLCHIQEVTGIPFEFNKYVNILKARGEYEQVK